ncbi:hypothetical protein [Subtercola sp. RTI3]|uniref:hypothetical protein n=1 Tax=Subtercola sp. RTI3 TaxID=3048639 RepID=UPI002B238361|nr:hypothetical protein [Subtercola sp. RTI3]MEA9984413.1 hypothetical protein [Subtercola sp. RTI3]
MPEDTADERLAVVTNRLRVLEDERDRLQGELDEIANRATDRWLLAVHYESSVVNAIQQTLSWRVTKPLRWVRHLQLSRRPRGGSTS